MYDIGVGPKSEWRTLGQKYPAMKVFGCEPHPGQYKKLLTSNFPGPLANVAIGMSDGKATLHMSTSNIGSSRQWRRGAN